MTEYEQCRTAVDKIAYGKDWLERHCDIKYDKLDKNIFPERVISYKLEDLSSYKPFLSDKLNAEEILNKAGIQEICIPTILSRRGPIMLKDIINLPEGKYIIKCGHASGWNFYFSSNDSIEYLKFVVDRINEYLTLNYAYIAGYEWQYESIEPGWIIQRVIDKDMPDYQFFYENGNLMAVDVQIKVDRNHVVHAYYGDINGNSVGHYIGSMPVLKTLTKEDKRILGKILPYAEILSKFEGKKIKFARIDFLFSNDKIYFCEYTFSPYAGNLTYKLI